MLNYSLHPVRIHCILSKHVIWCQNPRQRHPAEDHIFIGTRTLPGLSRSQFSQLRSTSLTTRERIIHALAIAFELLFSSKRERKIQISTGSCNGWSEKNLVAITQKLENPKLSGLWYIIASILQSRECPANIIRKHALPQWAWDHNGDLKILISPFNLSLSLKWVELFMGSLLCSN